MKKWIYKILQPFKEKKTIHTNNVYPYDELIKSLKITKDKFLKNRYHFLMIDIIHNSPNEKIQNDILLFNKKYLLHNFNNWNELLEFYSTSIYET